MEQDKREDQLKLAACRKENERDIRSAMQREMMHCVCVERVIDLTTIVPQPDPLRDQDIAMANEDSRRGRAMSAHPFQLKRVDRGTMKPEFPFRVPTARISFMRTAEERHASVCEVEDYHDVKGGRGMDYQPKVILLERKLFLRLACSCEEPPAT